MISKQQTLFPVPVPGLDEVQVVRSCGPSRVNELREEAMVRLDAFLPVRVSEPDDRLYAKIRDGHGLQAHHHVYHRLRIQPPYSRTTDVLDPD
jgi:hypothetical protein